MRSKAWVSTKPSMQTMTGGRLLRDAEGLDVQVDGLLIGLRKELDPTAVTLAHGVRMVVPDVDRCADRTIWRPS